MLIAKSNEHIYEWNLQDKIEGNTEVEQDYNVSYKPKIIVNFKNPKNFSKAPRTPRESLEIKRLS